MSAARSSEATANGLPRRAGLYHYNRLSLEELQADMLAKYAPHFVIGRDLDVY